MSGEGVLFLVAPFLMSLILIGIHCYLGLHVLARGVIFVDLALAQVAVFGTVLSLFLGMEEHTLSSYFFSLGMTWVAALVLALANRYKKMFSQEAFIGVLYALSSAAVVLLIDRLAHGAEHLKSALVGQLLWVNSSDVLKVFLIYFGVSLIHFIFRNQMIAVSKGEKESIFYDFLFYALFGVVITSSVRIVGVLMVFVFLIVPALLSGLFYSNWFHRLLFGWIFGAILCLIGMIGSYVWDLPSGAFLVVLFGCVPLLAILKKHLFR